MRFLSMSAVATVLLSLTPNIAAFPATTQSGAREYRSGKAYVLLHHCEVILTSCSVAIVERQFPNANPAKMPAVLNPDQLFLIATIAFRILAQRRFEEPFEGDLDVTAVTPQQAGSTALVDAAMNLATQEPPQGGPIVRVIQFPAQGLILRVSLSTPHPSWNRVITRTRAPDNGRVNLQNAIDAILASALGGNAESGSYPIARRVDVVNGQGQVLDQVVELLATLDIEWIEPQPNQTGIGQDPEGL
ncbi:hypothetical protein BDV95DRAFT_118330 [Massariosphaeria phaeospora]|uniref:Uncharacterized protein n=1 Tax=Massariosphaeria phaeospora TaxID=100035 RepID=A0A7C8I1W5_9PLEO|nr:hypothetical protein BDV95DRAFT_118330 [Massariosphaeria phaeospora]